MSNIEARRGSSIGFPERVIRKLTAITFSPILRSSIIDNNHSLDKAKEVSENGSGLIVVINHFSRKDPAQAISEIFHQSIINNRKIIAPIAYHMDNPFYHALGKINMVSIKSIVTQKTVEKGKRNIEDLNVGMKGYLDESISVLKEGGIVILSPQGTRMPKLGQPEKPAIGTLMAEAKRNGLSNYSFLFIGFGIEGVDDYSKRNGLNLFNKNTVNFGSCISSEEVLEKAKKIAEKPESVSKKTKNPLRFVDEVIYEELRKVVPPSYR